MTTTRVLDEDIALEVLAYLVAGPMSNEGG
jgi:hypothetical protein